MEDQATDCVTFCANFPDDSEWNKEGDLITPGGRAIASVLVECLIKQGLNVEPEKQHSYYAWLITVRSEKIRMELYLYDLQPWVLICEIKRKWFRKNALEDLHQQVITKLREVLHTDKRFSKVRWATKEELAAEGILKEY
ncbi:hypothetical protein [Gimesia fumaroli]|uniref:Uncharacterized protein n=1 Tax=Gimesia fumaroli TaxID=2527976 RepID=A0A518IJM3_9PLAN|nr:hypothetical protein [Gimesia fumaroli]QDV53293.1 hypothetical protein Enr17x_53670 [Gimesia fumaroli]